MVGVAGSRTDLAGPGYIDTLDGDSPTHTGWSVRSRAVPVRDAKTPAGLASAGANRHTREGAVRWVDVAAGVSVNIRKWWIRRDRSTVPGARPAPGPVTVRVAIRRDPLTEVVAIAPRP